MCIYCYILISRSELTPSLTKCFHFERGYSRLYYLSPSWWPRKWLSFSISCDIFFFCFLLQVVITQRIKEVQSTYVHQIIICSRLQSTVFSSNIIKRISYVMYIIYREPKLQASRMTHLGFWKPFSKEIFLRGESVG